MSKEPNWLRCDAHEVYQESPGSKLVRGGTLPGLYYVCGRCGGRSLSLDFGGIRCTPHWVTEESGWSAMSEVCDE